MGNVGGSDTQFVLQDLIRYSALPERCKNAQKPRRMFAAKMFWTALSEFWCLYFALILIIILIFISCN